MLYELSTQLYYQPNYIHATIQGKIWSEDPKHKRIVITLESFTKIGHYRKYPHQVKGQVPILQM